MKFSERLKDLRLSCGLTQRKVSQDFNITERAYQWWEAGRSEPKMGNLIKLADYFQVPLDYLVCRDDYLQSLEADAEES